MFPWNLPVWAYAHIYKKKTCPLMLGENSFFACDGFIFNYVLISLIITWFMTSRHVCWPRWLIHIDWGLQPGCTRSQSRSGQAICHRDCFKLFKGMECTVLPMVPMEPFEARGHETPCWSETALHHQNSHKGWTWICTQLYRILTPAIKLTFFRHLPMLYQHTLSALKSEHIFTLTH